MKHSLLLLSPHSFIDVITNSSSELFVCDTARTVEFVREYLEKTLELHNFGNDTDRKFEDVFMEPYIVDETNVDQFISSYVIGWDYYDWKWDKLGVEQPKDYWQWSREWTANNPSVQGETHDKSWERQMTARKAYEESWSSVNVPKIRHTIPGKIVVESRTDNSIPSEIMESICSTFNAHRIHLG